MPPTSLGAVVIFVFFFVPGLAYQQRRRKQAKRFDRQLPSFRDEPLGYLWRIVLASIVFTAMALAILYLIWRWHPLLLPDPERLIEDRQYRAKHAPLIAIASVAELGIALILTVIAAGIVHWRERRRIKRQERRRERSELYLMKPLLPKPYVTVQTKSGMLYSGFLEEQSEDLSLAERELILTAPRAMRADYHSRTMDGWESVTVQTSEITAASLSYRLDDKTIVRHPSKEALVYRLDDGTLIMGFPAPDIIRLRPEDSYLS
jgi:hypothetical protein